MNANLYPEKVTGGIAFNVCDIWYREINIIPLIVITALVQIGSFSIRMWSIHMRRRKLDPGDVTISIAFVSPHVSKGRTHA